MSGNGGALTREEWAARYLDSQGNLIPVPNNGGVPDRRIRFTEVDKYLEAVEPKQDVLGDPLAEFFTMTGGSFDERIQLPDDMQDAVASLIRIEYTGRLPEGWSIEVGQNAPAYGRGGGAYYSTVLDRQGMRRNLFELIDLGVIRVVPEP